MWVKIKNDSEVETLINCMAVDSIYTKSKSEEANGSGKDTTKDLLN